MRTFITILTIFVVTICCKISNKNKIQYDYLSNSIFSNSNITSDTLQRDLTGNYMVCNYRIQKKDTLYYYYAGTSNSCFQHNSIQMGVDSIYDLVYISEVKWFKYRFSSDSMAIIDSKKENRKYYNFAWPCQKGRITFYIENDTLFKLNPYYDSKYDTYREYTNDLPRWIPYAINRLNQNEFEIEYASTPFYPIVNSDSSKKIKTVFSKATITSNDSFEIWRKIRGIGK